MFDKDYVRGVCLGFVVSDCAYAWVRGLCAYAWVRGLCCKDFCLCDCEEAFSERPGNPDIPDTRQPDVHTGHNSENVVTLNHLIYAIKHHI